MCILACIGTTFACILVQTYKCKLADTPSELKGYWPDTPTSNGLITAVYVVFFLYSNVRTLKDHTESWEVSLDYLYTTHLCTAVRFLLSFKGHFM